MSRFLRDRFQTLEPYTPGEQPKTLGRLIKLNTNENPYEPAPGAVDVINSDEAKKLRLYSEPAASLLTEAIADFYGIRQEQVIAGNGSDEILAFIFMAFRGKTGKVWYPEISYSFYPVYCDIFGAEGVKVPLGDDFSVRPEDYYGADGTIVITTPNAPTGMALELSQIEDILENNRDNLVVIDEAYVDFGGESAIGLVDKYENLLVVRTFSKSRAMAGIRIGFAVGSSRVIRYLKDVKFSFNSYTMNAPSIAWGAASILDDGYFKETVGKIINTRERVKKELRELGFTFPDSRSNFLFVSHKSIPAAELFEALKQEGIYVRYFNKPRINNYLRITIGTDEEMDRLLTFLNNMAVPR